MARQSYVAFYEDAAKVEAAAKARGFTGNDGESWHDFVEAEHNKFRSSMTFATLRAAENWLSSEIRKTKSVYGQGTIIKQKSITERCRACVCGGVQATHEYTVDDTGIVDHSPSNSLCLGD